MALIDCGGKRSCACTLYSIFSSVIFGIVAVILRLCGLVAFQPAFLWVLLVVSLVYLAVLIAAPAYGNHLRECKCTILNTLLAGILGTVVFSGLLLGLGCIKWTVLSAVLGGLLIAFFSLMVTNTACFVKCLAFCEK